MASHRTIPAVAANTREKNSLEEIGSAVALLWQLLAALGSDQSRQKTLMMGSTSSFDRNPWALINDPAVMKAIVGGGHNSKPAGPQRPQNLVSWVDRVSVPMGMLEEMRPI